MDTDIVGKYQPKDIRPILEIKAKTSKGAK